MEIEQADAGRDGRTHLARTNSQARTGTGKYSFSLSQLTTSRISNLTRLIYTLLYGMTIHTYIHTYYTIHTYGGYRLPSPFCPAALLFYGFYSQDKIQPFSPSWAFFWRISREREVYSTDQNLLANVFMETRWGKQSAGLDIK